MARAPIPWLDKCRKHNHLIGYISNSNFKIFKFKTNFSLCRFLLQNIFLKFINIFVYFVFILVDAFSGSIKTEKTKNLSTLAENNLGERKLLCNFFAGTKRAVPGGQYRSILPARVANQNTEFAAYYPLGACHIIINTLTSSTLLLNSLTSSATNLTAFGVRIVWNSTS